MIKTYLLAMFVVFPILLSGCLGGGGGSENASDEAEVRLVEQIEPVSAKTEPVSAN